MKYSNQINKLKESPIRKLSPIASKAERLGKKIYYLNIGQPDIETPRTFFDAIKSKELKVLRYENSRGNPQLINSMISYFNFFDISLTFEDIIITSGASEAISFAVSIICNPEDEILLPEPFYTNSFNFLQQINVKIVPIATDEVNNYSLPNVKSIESLITRKTKAILITNPNNPTGTIYDENELKKLTDIAIKHDLFIIADEVYRSITFDNIIARSFFSLSNKAEKNLILVDSVSKRYSACGARIGALISKNKAFMNYAMKMATSRLSVSTLDQIGAIELYKSDFSFYNIIKKEYETRRNTVLEELSKIPNITYNFPNGAFYILVTLPIIDSEHFAKWMLETFDYCGESIFVAPARDFYYSINKGLNQIRIAYVYNCNILKKSIKILKHGLDQYLNEFGYVK